MRNTRLRDLAPSRCVGTGALAGVLAGIAVAAGASRLYRLRQDPVEAGLRTQNEHLNSLAEAKTDVLRMVSHELRGPLATVRGYLAMVEDGTLGQIPDEMRRLMPKVNAKLYEMNVLIDYLLETARLEDGRMQLSRRVVDLNEVLSQAILTVEPLTATTSPILVTPAPQPVWVDADPVRLQMIIGTLIDNAIKYSREQQVQCRVCSEGDSAMVSVADKGLGIDPENVARLFKAFGRLKTADSADIPGNGLGLHLARKVARLHGGDITVDSTRNVGSTFHLRLPLAEPDSADAGGISGLVPEAVAASPG